jgi:hypothetical protein
MTDQNNNPIEENEIEQPENDEVESDSVENDVSTELESEIDPGIEEDEEELPADMESNDILSDSNSLDYLDENGESKIGTIEDTIYGRHKYTSIVR